MSLVVGGLPTFRMCRSFSLGLSFHSISIHGSSVLGAKGGGLCPWLLRCSTYLSSESLSFTASIVIDQFSAVA